MEAVGRLGRQIPCAKFLFPTAGGYIVTSLLALMATPVDVGLEGQKMTHAMCASGQRRGPTIEKPHRDEPGVMSMRKSSLRRNARVDRQNETRQKKAGVFLSPPLLFSLHINRNAWRKMKRKPKKRKQGWRKRTETPWGCARASRGVLFSDSSATHGFSFL